MKLCESFYDGHIKLEQTTRLLFVVTYGLQVTRCLGYDAACKELGACIMHHLACESKLNNEGA